MLKVALVQSDWPGIGGGITYMDQLYTGLTMRDDIEPGYFVTTMDPAREYLPGSPYPDKPWVDELLCISMPGAEASARVLNGFDIIHFMAPGLWWKDKESYRLGIEYPPYEYFLNLLHQRRVMTVHCTYEEELFPYGPLMGSKVAFADRVPIMDYFQGKPGYGSVVFGKQPFEPWKRMDRAQLHSINRGARVISPTRISRHKRQHILIPQVVKMNTGDFILYGNFYEDQDYEYADKIRALLQVAGDNITYGGEFTGRDRPNVFSRALMSIDLTEFKEDGAGSQFAFLEACAYGCVPLMTPEWFGNGIVADLHGVPLPDVEKVWEVVNELLDDPAYLKVMRDNVMDYVEEHNYEYTIGSFVTGYEIVEADWPR
jgi:hypothetical protein